MAQYVQRHLEMKLQLIQRQFPILLLTGPRQVGKSTLLERIREPERTQITFDDPLLRAQADSDPALFFRNYHPPLLLDEIQYVPGLFPYLKMQVDRQRRDGDFWMTGSQAFSLMKNVGESLAGRVGILALQGISRREYDRDPFDLPFLPTEEYLEARRSAIPSSGRSDLWQAIHRGHMPELVFNPEKDWDVYYSSYVQTYLARDVRQLTQVADEALFLRFMVAIAARTGELLNHDAIAKDLGIHGETVRRWTSVLQTSGIIWLMPPYSNNHLKRAIKTPKVFFLDTGLAAWLTRWPTPETLANGAKAGSYFETWVVSEVVKSWLNAGVANPPMYFYRDRDGREIDLVIETADQLHPVEIKLSASPTLGMTKAFSALAEVPEKQLGTGAIICRTERPLWLSSQTAAIPAEFI